MAEARQDRAVFAAELELEQAILHRLKARRRAERVAKRRVFGRRQRGKHGPLIDQLVLHLLYAIEYFDGARQLVALQTFDRGVELVQDQLEPELRDLMLNDEQHLVVLGSVADRLLRAQQLVELQVEVVANFGAGSRRRRRCWNVFFRTGLLCHFVRLGLSRVFANAL
jgi:hypothetical protein